MKPISLQEIARVTQASALITSDPEQTINNVEFDSRKITPGSLFVPLVGGATDGHSYIQQVVNQGATATFWSNPIDEVPESDLAIIVVEDTLLAMQQLAAYYRELLNPIVIGITGSNGKTTTKDMTAAALTAKYRVHKTQGNFNNEIGLPYTLLQMPEDTEVAVIEMGMSGFGEIEVLSNITKPNIAAITLIGESHLEFLGSRAGIAQAKLEILSGLKDDGMLIYPGAEPLIEKYLPEISQTIKLRSFGFKDSYDVFAYDLQEEVDRTYFRTNLDSNVMCMIPVMGAYNVSNALIALTIAEVLDVPIEQAIFQLAQFKLTANRLEWLKTFQGAKLLNDAYNASPTSMKAVLETLMQTKFEDKMRKIAVLGDIRELGENSEQYHRELAKHIDPDRINRVYLFGSQMAYLYEELQKKYETNQLYYEPENHDKLVAALEESTNEKDVILVKSSFGVDLLKVVTALTGQETK